MGRSNIILMSRGKLEKQSMAPLPPTQIATAIFHRINEFAKEFRAGQRQQASEVDKMERTVLGNDNKPPSIVPTTR